MDLSRIPRWHGSSAALLLIVSLVAGCGAGSQTPADLAGGQTPADLAGSASASAVASADPSLDTAVEKSDRPITTLASKPGSKAIVQPANTQGRLLASNCFQCHGTLGSGGFDSIRGKEAGEVLEFMNKPASRDIMAAHAQGYTPAQLQQIIAYLKQ